MRKKNAKELFGTLLLTDTFLQWISFDSNNANYAFYSGKVKMRKLYENPAHDSETLSSTFTNLKNNNKGWLSFPFKCIFLFLLFYFAFETIYRGRISLYGTKTVSL